MAGYPLGNPQNVGITQPIFNHQFSDEGLGYSHIGLQPHVTVDQFLPQRIPASAYSSGSRELASTSRERIRNRHASARCAAW
ncbi:hypothetical protein E2562_026542 [Oryza meyeriana var. granulata]|uniref:Uncharacterized protein n=1 Tax=Oryza meyeriana var. granulata TaxID=110450 RepID=A0A6G1CT44_9ORYZ|nr:hypothetical protein E2562_026542 [Oryza meyeriana var. granulata]